MNRQKVSASEQIANFSTEFDASELTAQQRRLCVRSFADTYAVAIAGHDEPASIKALRYLECAALVQQTAASVPPVHCASLWGTGYRASAEVAAFYNAVAGHVIDYDDVTVPMRGHPSVVLWPALIALGDAQHMSGSRLAAAWTIGFEVICKLSRAMASAQYQRGWHCTASIGALGATVACCRLLGLDGTQTVHALGLAVAQCAGTRENVGTEAKSFQAGQANGAAVRAALLAQAGYQASPDALDGPHGYTSLYGQNESLGHELASLGTTPLELERSGLDVKQYPMCYATHRVLDGLLALRRERHIELSDVRDVLIHTSRGALLPLTRHRPKSGLEGKFSIEYAVAAALADGYVRLTSFTDEAVNRPALQQFFDCVRTSEDDGPIDPRHAEITVTLHDGTHLRRVVQTLHGSTEEPLTDEELLAKIADCLEWGKSPLSASRLFDLALGMGSLQVSDMMTQLG